MEKWEYRSVYISWQVVKETKGEKFYDWVVKFTDGSRVEEITAILNREGSLGWELVNLVAEYSESTGGYGGGASTTGYRAIFKRKVQ